MTEPARVLFAALLRAQPGQEWSADLWHDEAAMAQLKSAEVDAALKAAVRAGLLVPIPGGTGRGWTAVPSTVPSRKGGGVRLYRRTSVLLPDKVPQEVGA